MFVDVRQRVRGWRARAYLVADSPREVLELRAERVGNLRFSTSAHCLRTESPRNSQLVERSLVVERVRQRDRSPPRGSGRDELAPPVRKPRFEVRLNRERAGPDEPRSIFELRAQQKIGASSIRGSRWRHAGRVE